MEKEERREAAALEDRLLEEVTGGTDPAATRKTLKEKAQKTRSSLSTGADGLNPVQNPVQQAVEKATETKYTRTKTEKVVTTRTITTVQTATFVIPERDQ